MTQGCNHGEHTHDHSHGHGHDHSHGHGHHHHVPKTADGMKRVFWAMVATALFAGAEVAGGLISGSLALIADAAHMMTDALSLGLAWVGFRLATKAADRKRTYGYDRFQILVAFVNGLALYGVIIWIVYEAVVRMISPETVEAAPMLGVAVGGLFVNIIAFAILHGADRNNLNLRGALLHVLGDLLGSVAAIAAAVVIMFTGWMPIDPILSLAVAALLVRSATSLVLESVHILLEGAPVETDIEEVAEVLRNEVKDVIEVHHLHAWSLSQETPMITLHARLRKGADNDRVLSEIQAVLVDRFGFSHSTVQIEYDGQCNDPIHEVA